MSTPRKPRGSKKPPKSIWDLSPEKGECAPDPIGFLARNGLLPEDEDPSNDPKRPPPTFKDIDAIVKQAGDLAPGPLGFLLWMELRFAVQGQHAMSPWWRTELARYFASEKTWALFCLGRGGGKSSTLVRVALLYTLFGCLFEKRQVPPGQRWIWPFISAGTQDASRRINETQALLRGLNIEAKMRGSQFSKSIDLCDVVGNDVSVLSIAGTIAGVSGPSAIGATIDEEAKLRDAKANSNPATEILASIVQMFRSRAGVHAIRCSSAWRAGGSHYSSIVEGETEKVFVARIGEEFLSSTRAGFLDVAGWETAQGNTEAAQRIKEYAASLSADSPFVPTWTANPTISAMASRLDTQATPISAEDQALPRWRIWLRENGSVPIPGSDGTPGPTLDDMLGFAEFNEKQFGGGRRRRDGLSDNEMPEPPPGYIIDDWFKRNGPGGKGKL